MALGVYPAQSLRQFIADGIIKNASDENIQPSTLDLSLSDEAYRMKGVFLPRKHETVRDIISEASISFLRAPSKMEPLEMDVVIGKKADKNYSANEIITFGLQQ